MRPAELLLNPSLGDTVFPQASSLAGLGGGLVCLGKSLALEITHSHHLPEECIKVFTLQGSGDILLESAFLS